MHTLKISTISVLCVLCTVATNAFGAGSVRALGGSGTYNGTTAATTATTTSGTSARAGTATRAGSLRISPSTTRSVSTGTRTNTDGTTAPTERLSIGKYLGGATSVSTSGGASSASASDIQQINQQITEIINNADGLADRIDALEASKQDALTAGDYIIISEDDEVSVDITELEEYLTENLDLPNKVKIRYVAADDALEWSEDGGTTWSRLFSIADLAGDYISESELDNKIEELAKYATKEELDAKQPKSTVDYALGTAEGSWSALSEDQIAALNSGVTADTVEQVATNTDDIADLADSIDGLSGTQSIISSAPNPGVFVLGVVDGEQALLPVAPDSQGNY